MVRRIDAWEASDGTIHRQRIEAARRDFTREVTNSIINIGNRETINVATLFSSLLSTNTISRQSIREAIEAYEKELSEISQST